MKKITEMPTGKIPSEVNPFAVTVEHYSLLVFLGLGAVILSMVQQGQAIPAVILAGLGFVMTRFRVGLSPVWLLAPIFVSEILANWAFTRGNLAFPRPFQIDDLMRSLGAMVSFAGMHRLHAFWFGIHPLDRRLVDRADKSLQLRPSAGLTPIEIGVFLGEAVLALALVQLVAGSLFYPRRVWDLPPKWVLLILLIWIPGATGVLIASLFRVWRQRSLTPELARLALQDDLWKETRREQRRNNRWLVWRRLLSGWSKG